MCKLFLQKKKSFYSKKYHIINGYKKSKNIFDITYTIYFNDGSFFTNNMIDTLDQVKEDLKKLGINLAFDDQFADFSNMADEPLHVDDAIHKADFKFSENPFDKKLMIIAAQLIHFNFISLDSFLPHINPPLSTLQSNFVKKYQTMHDYIETALNEEIKFEIIL